MEEEYVSKMMGEEYASYARPMDADEERRGPLVSCFFGGGVVAEALFLLCSDLYV